MPRSPSVVYTEHAADHDAATQLDDLPDAFHELLESFMTTLNGPAVLDAGCGAGRDTEYFYRQGLSPTGIDIAPGMIARARANRPGTYTRMDMRDLSFETSRFDGVWCPASIFFLPVAEMPSALSEFVRVLRPSGTARIGFKVGDGQVTVDKWGSEVQEHHLSQEKARELLTDTGFDIVSVDVASPTPEKTFANYLCTAPDNPE